MRTSAACVIELVLVRAYKRCVGHLIDTTIALFFDSQRGTRDGERGGERTSDISLLLEVVLYCSTFPISNLC